MAVVVHRKLVRDRIPDIIRESGSDPVCRILSKEELREELKNKLCEEAEEFRRSGEKEELADVLEVLRAIMAEMNLTFDELERIRAEKYQERGGFADGVWLEKVLK